MKKLLAAVGALTLAAPSIAKVSDEAPAPSPDQIVEAASQEEWVTIPAEDLLIMTLAYPDRGPGQASHDGNAREVVIQLMPAPFSQGWVHNIKLLARSGWYDETAIIRVQDNYVAQWGDPDADSEDAKPLPEGLKVLSEDEYLIDYSVRILMERNSPTRVEAKPPFVYIPADETYGKTAFSVGFPVGLSKINRRRGSLKAEDGRMHPVHCYGMVGVARDLSPNTGDGSSLYTVIGHAPRHLDRNIALVGRVIEGMEHLSSLPRGKGELGFYEDESERTPIISVEIAADIEEFPQPTFEFLSTESESFARYAEARANRRDPFFIHPAGGADICNIPVPVRRVVTD